MTEPTLDVVALGNAIVDVLSNADDAFLAERNLAKGGMQLIDQDQATNLYNAMGPGVEHSGGSAANTAVGVAALGGRSAFIGRVQDDQLGEVFAHDIRAAGVTYSAPAAKPGLGTARCLILVTPDAQRTMNTFLGASAEIGPDDVDADLVASGRITYLEGYLWDQPLAKQAMRRAADVARDAGRQVAMSLSDAFCVDRHRDEFRDLVEGPLDIVFANEAEIMSLYQTDSFETALDAVRGKVQLAVLTRSEKGCVIVAPDGVHEVPASPPTALVDTTGAGDLFAAGFLRGITSGRGLVDAGRIGAVAAAEIISHYGARPEADLKQLVTGI
ncbi:MULTISPECIES: adenosine kinase [unclassified Minwuia]|jgi:sugar/nucleoside kinase (ribokinase family)|uniref:adenosine kinase n=1 Tax=unclassified Minwuia TaxID=2618799 RepID=UPI002478A347|nr:MULTISPECIES: adenosine kinase [unclassified Minwuia]